MRGDLIIDSASVLALATIPPLERCVCVPLPLTRSGFCAPSKNRLGGVGMDVAVSTGLQTDFKNGTALLTIAGVLKG